jgi:hypothetical protein
MSGKPGAAPAPVALVAFTGQTDLWWLRALKPGFRHCFVVLRSEGRWLLYDPMAHATALRVLDGEDGTDLFGQLLAAGYVVVPVRVRPAPPRRAPLAPFTCVEAVKRALGIQARWVLTPWDLFRFLVKGKKALT